MTKKYKIEVIDFGSWIPYLYVRTFWGKWKFVQVGNVEPYPYWGSALELKEKYNVPDERFIIKTTLTRKDERLKTYRTAGSNPIL